MVKRAWEFNIGSFTLSFVLTEWTASKNKRFWWLITGAVCIKKWLKLTMISRNVNQSEQRILYLITI